MNNSDSFARLLDIAIGKLNHYNVNEFISCGGVSSAIETSTGRNFVGVCIEAACAIGMCAERNAIGTMITEGEYQVKKMVCLNSQGIVLPCGVCRELLIQLQPLNQSMEILADNNGNIITLSDLMPKWWGRERFSLTKKGYF